MDNKENFSIADLETAVSMASIADESYSSQVFSGIDALELIEDTPQQPKSESNTSLIGSDGSMTGTQSANSFQYTALDNKSFSSVGLKPNDPMWQTCLTPEPAISPQPKLDPEFIDDLLTMVDDVPPVLSTSLEASSLPYQPVTATHRHHPKKSSSHSNFEPLSHIFSWGRSHSPPNDVKMDCSVDGQKVSSDKGHRPHLKWPHRTKHHSVSEDKKSGEHGSSHHFQEIVHYFRRFSHSHSSHDNQKEMDVDKETGTEPARRHRVHRISSGGDGDKSAPPILFRDRSHSMGAKPKKRADPQTIQAVYTIYDNIVKEGKPRFCRRRVTKLKRVSVGGCCVYSFLNVSSSLLQLTDDGGRFSLFVFPIQVRRI